MASAVWGSVHIILWIELFLMALLVLPLARRYRNILCRVCSKLNLKRFFQVPAIVVIVSLVMCLLEVYIEFKQVEKLKNRSLKSRYEGTHGEINMVGSKEDMQMVALHEREYRAERNLYLVGFALTLLLSIARMTTLMQETVELEDECKARKEAGKEDTPKKKN